MSEDINTSTSTRAMRRPGQRLTSEEKRKAQDKFLKTFANTANLRAAAMQAGVDRKTIYTWLEKDEQFSFKYHQAEAEANDAIRGEIWRRAIQGVEEPVVSVGKLVYVEDEKEKGKMKPLTVRKYSDNLLALLAKARMPEFRDKQSVEMSGPDGEPLHTGMQVTFYLPQVTPEEGYEG